MAVRRDQGDLAQRQLRRHDVLRGVGLPDHVDVGPALRLVRRDSAGDLLPVPRVADPAVPRARAGGDRRARLARHALVRQQAGHGERVGLGAVRADFLAQRADGQGRLFQLQHEHPLVAVGRGGVLSVVPDSVPAAQAPPLHPAVPVRADSRRAGVSEPARGRRDRRAVRLPVVLRRDRDGRLRGAAARARDLARPRATRAAHRASISASASARA